MVDGRPAMVEHAHGEHRVEAFQLRRQFFQRQWQVPGGEVGQEALHGQELAEEQPVGIDAHHAVGACTQHAPLVVAIAAADIQYAASAQVQMRGDSRPLPVRTPFGIDVHTEYFEGTFAPGNQSLQCGFQCGSRGFVAGAVEQEALRQFHLLRLQGRQGIERRAPAFEVAVADRQLGVELRGQVGCPVLQLGARQSLLQGVEVQRANHGRAISEAKLRHWNQGTTLENPAASRRSRCSSRLSGCMTFSSALRFWAISSSL
ncbi:hypothetical protein FQZ97_524330 [compost metagenome]